MFKYLTEPGQDGRSGKDPASKYMFRVIDKNTE